jgi:proline iminopeptidase
MFLDVGDGHRLYYKQFGNPKGKPVVVLHGGPGGGLQRGALKAFNLKKWCVTMFDQRGCGKSTPFLSLHKNTTWDLVDDIEKLRIACNVTQWTVFGGSWGSTLALAYASKHIDRISALVLRGIYLGDKTENDWLYGPDGAARLYPDEWAAFSAESKVKGSLIKTYKRLLSDRRTRKAAARRWWGWEAAISSLRPMADKAKPSEVESLAVIENYYFSHNCWLRPGQLLAAARRIPKSIPVIIVQGRYDLVCPPVSAVALSKAVAHSKLKLTISGHAGADPENAKAVRSATDSL